MPGPIIPGPHCPGPVMPGSHCPGPMPGPDVGAGPQSGFHVPSGLQQLGSHGWAGWAGYGPLVNEPSPAGCAMVAVSTALNPTAAREAASAGMATAVIVARLLNMFRTLHLLVELPACVCER